MRRVFGHAISSDMIVLWAVETLVCFLGVYAGIFHGLRTSLIPGDNFYRSVVYAADVAILLGFVCAVFGLYKPTAILKPVTLFASTGLAALCALSIFWIVLVGGMRGATSPWANGSVSLLLAFYWLLFLVGTRLLYIVAIRFDLLTRTVVAVGDTATAQGMARLLSERGSPLFRVVAVDGVGSAKALTSRVWRFVTMPGDAGMLDAAGLAGCQARVVDIYSFLEMQFGRLDLHGLERRGDLDAVTRGSQASAAARVCRRALDIAAAVGLLVLTAPVMLATALAVKLSSPGPVIYRQERVGLVGRPFVILKFRSMRADAERDGVAVWASVGDRRVTAVGSFIRRVRIDELPQLVNVLRGDMSLVGPRPERPSLTETLNAAIPNFDRRTLVKPGLTGWAQINSAYTATAAEAREKLTLDLYYIKHRTLAFDLMILVATVRIMIFQVGSR